jgi:hypothetical protein
MTHLQLFYYAHSFHIFSVTLSFGQLPEGSAVDYVPKLLHLGIMSEGIAALGQDIQTHCHLQGHNNKKLAMKILPKSSLVWKSSDHAGLVRINSLSGLPDSFFYIHILPTLFFKLVIIATMHSISFGTGRCLSGRYRDIFSLI